MPSVFRNIGVIGKQNAPAIAETIKSLVDFLLEHSFTVYANEHASHYVGKAPVTLTDNADVLTCRKCASTGATAPRTSNRWTAR